MRARMAILLQPDFWIAAAMTLLAGVVRGFAGFGAAIIQAPVFALLYPPAEAVATLAALGTVASLQLLPGVARESTPRQLAPLIALGLLAVPLGSLVLVTVAADTMRRAISAIVLVMVVALLGGVRYPGRPGPWSAAGVGALSGLLNGATGVGGPPVVLYFLAGPQTAATNRANLIVYYTFLNGCTAAALLWHGAYTPATVLRTAALWPVQVLSLWVGAWLFRRVGDTHYRRIAMLLMLAVALFGLFYRR